MEKVICSAAEEGKCKKKCGHGVPHDRINHCDLVPRCKYGEQPNCVPVDVPVPVSEDAKYICRAVKEGRCKKPKCAIHGIPHTHCGPVLDQSYCYLMGIHGTECVPVDLRDDESKRTKKWLDVLAPAADRILNDAVGLCLDFSEVQEGDPVIDTVFGPGTVTMVLDPELDALYSFQVEFWNGTHETYTIDGKRDENARRSLYYPGTLFPEIIPAPRPAPKKKVQHRVCYKKANEMKSILTEGIPQRYFDDQTPDKVKVTLEWEE